MGRRDERRGLPAAAALLDLVCFPRRPITPPSTLTLTPTRRASHPYNSSIMLSLRGLITSLLLGGSAFCAGVTAGAEQSHHEKIAPKVFIVSMVLARFSRRPVTAMLTIISVSTGSPSLVEQTRIQPARPQHLHSGTFTSIPRRPLLRQL